jgi:hypothetical protein
MPCRRLLWMPIGEARLKSSTFLHGQSARKKVTYEVRDAVRSGETAQLYGPTDCGSVSSKRANDFPTSQLPRFWLEFCYGANAATLVSISDQTPQDRTYAPDEDLLARFDH